MKTELLFKPEAITKKTAQYRRKLLANTGCKDFAANGARVFARRVAKKPGVYRRFGPYWWAVKEVLVKHKAIPEGAECPEISAVYRGQNDDETLVAGEMFYEYYLSHYFDGNNRFALDPEALEDWVLWDPDMEMLAAVL